MDWQLSVLQWIQQYRHPFVDVLFEWVTITAEETIYILIAAWLLWCRDKTLAHRVGIIFLSGMVMNATLKNLFVIERPIGLDGVDSMRTHTATGYSFPSGHTQSATTFWFSLMLQVRQRWFQLLAAVLILMVAFSRLYLGVHWPMDVIAGVLFGVVWVLFVNRLFDYAQAHSMAILWSLLVPFILAFMIYPDDKDLITVFGAAIGFMAGMQLELKTVNYQVGGGWPQQAVKLLVGLGILLALKVGLKAVFVFPPQYADLLRYAAIGFWLTYGAPLLFSKIRWLNAA